MTPLMVDLAATTAGSPDNSSAWFALGGALGGVLLTGVIGLTTAVLTHRWQSQATSRQILDEHAVRLRQERRETYAAYWSAWNRLIHQLQELSGHVVALPQGRSIGNARWTIDALRGHLQDDALEALAEAYAKVKDAELEWRAAVDSLFLIGGPEVVIAAEQHRRATYTRFNDSFKGLGIPEERTYQLLNTAMRADIISAPSAESSEGH